MTYLNFKTFEEYLRELDSAQTDRLTDRQTECINTFQLCWKVLKNSARNLYFNYRHEDVKCMLFWTLS